MAATLEDVLTDANIVVRAEASTWEEAIALSAQPLLETGSITPEYVDAIVKSAHEFGPYFVLVPHVALAHARPEHGVRELGVTVATLAEPIEFGSEDNDPVTVVVCLAATDASSHLELLRSLVSFIGDPERVEALSAATDKDQIRSTLFARA